MNDPRIDDSDALVAVRSELRQVRDELRVKIRLAAMDARSAWERFEPRLQELERHAEAAAELAARTVQATVEELKGRLRQLRDEIESREGAA